ncbi:hypothetical protein [Nitrosopumilus ureiphilus]|nr:hypothetical protein [Nitrosopumilus ureiphilus]
MVQNEHQITDENTLFKIILGFAIFLSMEDGYFTIAPSVMVT